MKFGICTSIDHAPAVRAAGWDYLEENAQSLLQGLAPDAQWDGERKVRSSPAPIVCANMLVPAALKITGAEADSARLREYLKRVTVRAKKVGIGTLVFGSGGARQAPEAFDRARAEDQLLSFSRDAAEIAAAAGVIIALEHLNRGECNIVNSVAEAAAVVRAVNRPSFRLLVDSYHFWVENEPLKSISAAVDLIAHVHVADLNGRTPPGESGSADYRPLFQILKEGGYDSHISVEGNFPEPMIRGRGRRILEFLKKQWQES